MLPVEEIRAYCMAPRHIAPEIAFGVMLVEEVIFTAVEKQSVGIIHPITFRCEVKTGAELFTKFA